MESTKITKLIMTGVDVWTTSGVLKQQHVEICSGKITQLSSRPIPNKGHTPLEIKTNSVLIPLGVDPQVHMRVPGQAHKETAETALAAAIKGGVGALLTMPNTKPVIDNLGTLEECKNEIQQAQKKYPVHVDISAAITVGQKGQQAVNFKELAQYGVRAFTDDGVGVVDDEIMRAAFRASSEWNLLILQHAEYPGHGAVLAEGPVQQKLCMPPYKPEAEYEMVARDLHLLRDFPEARYHVLHVSTQKTVELVARAKDKGLQVSCEVSPHHLFFNCTDIREENSSFKMNPPLRSRSEQLFLQNALRDGLIDFVATDHAPHEAEVKTTNFKTAAFGTTGLETSLRTLLYLRNIGLLNEKRLVEVFSNKPAEFLGVHSKYGDIHVNQNCYVSVVSNVNSSSKISTEDLASLSKNNCFVGAELPGSIDFVLIEDRVFKL